MTRSDRLAWWQRPALLAALVLLSVAPLLWPELPPLTDLPGHVARWHIATAGPDSPLAHYYAIDWSLVGNLGADIPGVLLAPLIGPIAAGKLIVILIVLLTGAAMLWLTREAHGRVPPTALFALPFAYGWAFQWGFVNFALSQAMAFAALALWLRLAARPALVRAAVFAPIGFAIWVAHSGGWGLFGLMAFGAELAIQREHGRNWPSAIGRAMLDCLPLALPLILMIANAHGGRAGDSGDWFDLPVKLLWAISALRDRWQWFDLASLGALLFLLYVAARDPRLGYAKRLGWPALAAMAGFILLPRLLMGGAYVDMRLMPAVWALALLAIRPTDVARFASRLALAGLVFLAMRTAGTTISFIERAAQQSAELAVLPAIPRGATLLSLVVEPCDTPWSSYRAEHLPAYAIITRDAFTNEQWAIPGQQYLHIRYGRAYPLITDPSQVVYPTPCDEDRRTLTHALASFRRDAFSHVWILNRRLLRPARIGLAEIWTNGRSALYEVAGDKFAPRVEPSR